MSPLSTGTDDYYAMIPLVYINTNNSFFDLSLGRLTASEQEAVDRVKDKMSEKELRTFIKGLRR